MTADYINVQREMVVIEKFVRKKMMAFLSETGMSKYEFPEEVAFLKVQFVV